jgi:hypothetical protein
LSLQFEVQIHNSYNLLPGTKSLQVVWKRGTKSAATKVGSLTPPNVPAPTPRRPPAPPAFVLQRGFYCLHFRNEGS